VSVFITASPERRVPRAWRTPALLRNPLSWTAGVYFAGRVRGLKARLLDRFLAVRAWMATGTGVTHFIAISETIRQRIAGVLRRDRPSSTPVTDFYARACARDFYFVVSESRRTAARPGDSVCNRLGIARRHRNRQDAVRMKGSPGRRCDCSVEAGESSRPPARCRACFFPGEEDSDVPVRRCLGPVMLRPRRRDRDCVGPWRETTGLFFASSRRIVWSMPRTLRGQRGRLLSAPRAVGRCASTRSASK